MKITEFTNNIIKNQVCLNNIKNEILQTKIDLDKFHDINIDNGNKIIDFLNNKDESNNINNISLNINTADILLINNKINKLKIQYHNFCKNYDKIIKGDINTYIQNKSKTNILDDFITILTNIIKTKKYEKTLNPTKSLIIPNKTPFTYLDNKKNNEFFINLFKCNKKDKINNSNNKLNRKKLFPEKNKFLFYKSNINK